MARHGRDGMKDTIESIVIALVLAFVFRAFVVEAFIIPTGSMAPTLYGAHATLVCEDCGYEFAYGLRDPDDRPGAAMVSGEHAAAVCPNCNHAHRHLAIRDDTAARVPPHKGDRILVLKWPFDFGGRGLDPERWDVIVFKDPSDGTTNFIKRCAGLPGEVLSIIDGDVFTVPLAELGESTRAELENQVRQKHLVVSGQVQGGIPPLSEAAFAELDRKFRIPRKTPEAQKVLWFPVFDADHTPRTIDAYQPYWTPAQREKSGWQVFGPLFQYQPGDQPVDFLILSGREIRAHNAYNMRGAAVPLVSDVRVRFVFTPGDGAGVVRVRLSKWSRHFWAGIHADGTVTLAEGRDEIPAGPFLATARLAPFTAGRPVAVEFEIVDYRLAVRIAGRELLASSDDPASPGFYGPDFRVLRKQASETTFSPPRIYGGGGSFDLTHLVVDRDVYYYHDGRMGPVMPGARWAPRQGWGSAADPIMLRDGEYFMLGDNTAASKDSRLWDAVGPHMRDRGEAFQLGTVPRDQLIGKAFFVYWPAGHRIDWLPLLNRFGLIPDVGRMRWIR
jgi:signal peptidase I